MIERIGCEGAPRDLGLDQGRACRTAIARALARAGPARSPAARVWAQAWRWWPGASRAPGERLWVEVRRHLPHAAECLEGLAFGARVSRVALTDLLARGAASPAGMPVFEAELSSEGSGPVLGGGPLGEELDWVLRETRPESGYPCLVVTRSWLPGAVAGVNAKGLAAAWQPAPRPRRAPQDVLVAAPSFLLEQCLERFDGVEKCLEWCERRPGGGEAVLLFADAHGTVGAVQRQAGGARRLRSPGPLPKAPSTAGATGLRVRVFPGARALEWSDGGRGRRELLAG